MCRQLCVIILCCSMGTKAALYCNLGIVEDNPFGDAAKEPKCANNRIQKAFQVLLPVSNYIRCATVTESGTE